MSEGVSVTIEFDKFPVLAAMAPAAVAHAVRDTLIEIEQDVKGGPHAAPIDTGNLRRSYHWEMDGATAGEVGNDVSVAPYAIYVEFGTHKMAAQPHLRPAAEAQRQKFNERVSAQVAAAMKV